MFDQMQSIFEKLKDKIFDWVENIIVMLPNLLFAAVKQIDYLLKGNPVDLYFKEFGDSAIIFSVRYWVQYIPGNHLVYLQAISDGIKNIKKAYDENDITITFPIRTIDFGIKGGESLADMLTQVKK